MYATTARSETMGRYNHIPYMPGNRHTRSTQCCAHRGVAFALIEGVLINKVQFVCLNSLAQLQQRFRAVLKRGGIKHFHWDTQCCQLGRKLVQTPKLECKSAISHIMTAPLLDTDTVHTHHFTTGSRSCQRGVVAHAKIIAEPDQFSQWISLLVSPVEQFVWKLMMGM